MDIKTSIELEISHKRDEIHRFVDGLVDGVGLFSIENSAKIERKLGEIDAYEKTLSYLDYFKGEII